MIGRMLGGLVSAEAGNWSTVIEFHPEEAKP
jgi:hypothetical protein